MTTSTLTRPLSPALSALRSELERMGVTADSPEDLDPEAEYLYRLEQGE